MKSKLYFYDVSTEYENVNDDSEYKILDKIAKLRDYIFYLWFSRKSAKAFEYGQGRLPRKHFSRGVFHDFYDWFWWAYKASSTFWYNVVLIIAVRQNHKCKQE